MHEEELVGHAALFPGRGVGRKNNLRNSGNGESRRVLFLRRSSSLSFRTHFRRPP